MTGLRRIIINTAATYGRSLLSLICGLFTARWVLLSLGKSDFGLYGLVGGLTVFMSFLSNLLSFAIGRFYAYEVGRSQVSADSGVEMCKKWFNTALSIHCALSFVLIALGYPLGIWMVRDFLEIPVDRIGACVWVWRFSCVACFFSIFTVPFQAMYVAKQEIAELTVYSVCTTVVNFCFSYYMVLQERDWLAAYAGWMCAIAVVPQIIICMRALRCYAECTIRREYLWSWSRTTELFKYAASRLWTGLTIMFDTQGQALLVNKYLGSGLNATMNIGNSVAAHSQSLSTALSGAFWPAVTNMAGQGNLVGMRNMAMCACKFGAILFLVFALPLVVEINEVMRLWLKAPPDHVAEFCIFIMCVALIEKMTDGHWMSIMALGRIKRYSFFVGLAGLSSLCFSWLLLGLGFGIVGVGVARLLGKLLVLGVRLYYGNVESRLSVKYWVSKIMLPTMLVSGGAVIVGSLPKVFFAPSLFRVGATTVVIEIVFVPLVWFYLLTSSERLFVVSKIRAFRELLG